MPFSAIKKFHDCADAINRDRRSDFDNINVIAPCTDIAETEFAYQIASHEP